MARDGAAEPLDEAATEAVEAAPAGVGVGGGDGGLELECEQRARDRAHAEAEERERAGAAPVVGEPERRPVGVGLADPVPLRGVLRDGRRVHELLVPAVGRERRHEAGGAPPRPLLELRVEAGGGHPHHQQHAAGDGRAQPVERDRHDEADAARAPHEQPHRQEGRRLVEAHVRERRVHADGDGGRAQVERQLRQLLGGEVGDGAAARADLAREDLHLAPEDAQRARHRDEAERLAELLGGDRDRVAQVARAHLARRLKVVGVRAVGRVLERRHHAPHHRHPRQRADELVPRVREPRPAGGAARRGDGKGEVPPPTPQLHHRAADEMQQQPHERRAGARRGQRQRRRRLRRRRLRRRGRERLPSADRLHRLEERGLLQKRRIVVVAIAVAANASDDTAVGRVPIHRSTATAAIAVAVAVAASGGGQVGPPPQEAGDDGVLVAAGALPRE